MHMPCVLHELYTTQHFKEPSSLDVLVD